MKQGQLKHKEKLKCIASGQKPSEPNTDIDAIEGIVAKVKNREEVTIAYMRQWDRELSIKRETKANDATIYELFAKAVA